MSYMVVFQSADGNSSNHQSESLEDASIFVERLRNDQNVENARLYRMEEIHFELRPYYKVEIAGAPAVGETATTADAAADVPLEAAATPVDAPVEVEEVAAAPAPPVVEAPEPAAVLETADTSKPVIESFGGGSSAPASTPAATPAGNGGSPAAGAVQPQRRGLFGR